MKTIVVVLISLIATLTNSNTTTEVVEGRFYNTVNAYTQNYEEQTLYQFRSDDNSVWWLLTEEEIGEIPNTTDRYILAFNNNGTTATHKNCDCVDDTECECYVYDDELISITKK